MRRAITLLELLVVVSVVAILMALLLPATQAARESGRKLACQNNLKQIGIATVSFEATYRQLPSNGWGYRWIFDSSRRNGVAQPGGWIGQIAPYAGLSLPAATTDNIEAFNLRTKLTETPWGLMSCPSRTGGMSLASTAASPYNASFVAFVSKTDYAANEGDFITNTDGGPQSIVQGDSPTYPWISTKDTSGVIFLRSTVRLTEISDGTSNTYLCGEKYVSKNHYFDGGDLGYDQSLFSGVDLDLNRWTISPPKQDANSSQTRLFGSAHTGSCNMVLCDSSVTQVSYSVDAVVHRSRGNRHDQR